jgi:hypothetical protein
MEDREVDKAEQGDMEKVNQYESVPSLESVGKEQIEAALHDVYGADVEIVFTRSPYNRNKIVIIRWVDCGANVQIEYTGRDFKELAMGIGLAYYRVQKGILLDLERRGVIRKGGQHAERTGEKAQERSGGEGVEG